MNETSKLSWLNTSGGPLLLIPSHSIMFWKGTSSSIKPTDYERACKITGLLGTVKVRDDDILVLGDEPMMTAWRLHKSNRVAGDLIRWVWADTPRNVVELADSLIDVDFSIPSERIRVTGPMQLIDSSLDYSLAPRGLDIELDVGLYEVRTANASNGRAKAVVHRLFAVS